MLFIKNIREIAENKKKNLKIQFKQIPIQRKKLWQKNTNQNQD